MGNNQHTTWLSISPDDKKSKYKAVCWHHTISIMNDYRHEGEEHINSKEIWNQGDNWWDSYQERYSSIEKLDIGGEIPSYDFIKQLTNLRSLSIVNSNTFNHLHYIEGLQSLEYLQIIQCKQVSDITPIIQLRNKQKEIIQSMEAKGTEDPDDLRMRLFNMPPELSHINLTACNISSLEPFREDQGLGMDELHLDWNHIADVEPLGIMNHAYLSLSHNQIENIKPLFEPTEAQQEQQEWHNYYGINLRHNLIKDISQIERHPTMIPMRIKLWLGHNPIPHQQLAKWREDDFVWLMDI